MFCGMCDVEEHDDKNRRAKGLCAVEPLEDGAAFELVGDKEVWHPLWDNQVDHKINTQFLQTVADRVYDNEKVPESCPWKYILTHCHVESSRNQWGEGRTT